MFGAPRKVCEHNANDITVATSPWVGKRHRKTRVGSAITVESYGVTQQDQGYEVSALHDIPGAWCTGIIAGIYQVLLCIFDMSLVNCLVVTFCLT